MTQLIKALFTTVALIPAVVFAHGAPRITLSESIVINAEPAVVWKVISQFDNAHGWIPAVESTSAEGGNEVGATRVLSLHGGATVTEKLKRFDAEKMSYMYQITDISKVGEVEGQGEMHDVPALPVSKYKSWVSVEATDGGSKVTWVGKFFRAYHGSHEPIPVELNDETAEAAVKGLYQSSLENLKVMLEK